MVTPWDHWFALMGKGGGGGGGRGTLRWYGHRSGLHRRDLEEARRLPVGIGLREAVAIYQKHARVKGHQAVPRVVPWVPPAATT